MEAGLDFSLLATKQMEDVSFRKALEALINYHSRENGSDTADFILADYLSDSLQAFDRAVNAREIWYGRKDAIDV